MQLLAAVEGKVVNFGHRIGNDQFGECAVREGPMAYACECSGQGHSLQLFRPLESVVLNPCHALGDDDFLYT